ncbi:putative protein N(5)-glutamine methyltransferase [Sinomonas atrocyanea]|uniref:putative protein N(5)-glutamine methyltransferase n=1 Tax=Sinomonas atrocyanea TaxID=37927 RepID=UPI00285E25DD|nr:putative protein N(5)-glutamine methyltransferase [Sinomonas atrocyanea]MDR6621428.1 release factor glutamine methyltransferase [Sinomonas atrocyanea]
MTSAWPESAPPLLADVAGRLRAAGCVFAEEEAALLIEAAEDRGHLDRLVALRAAGEPLEHLVGWAEFAGLRVAVGPGVFVPRRRSELLVRLAAAALANDGGGAPAVVVDLCCGSAALGAGLAAALGARGWAPGGLELHAADLDPAAAPYARRNLAPWGGQVHTGDLFAALPGALRGRVDVIIANAPYVPTAAIALMPPEARDHEPRASLDGGADGLALHRRIAAEAGGWLAPGGTLVIEVGRTQAAAALRILAEAGLVARAEEDEDLGGTAVVAVSG